MVVKVIVLKWIVQLKEIEHFKVYQSEKEQQLRVYRCEKISNYLHFPVISDSSDGKQRALIQSLTGGKQGDIFQGLYPLSLSVTLNVYTHLKLEDAEKEIKRLENVEKELKKCVQ